MRKGRLRPPFSLSLQNSLHFTFLNQNLSYWDRVAAAAWILAMLIYLHPYYGIRHDSVLYLGQGLLAVSPENFRKDLFFAYGSQASFTVLPAVLGLLLGHFTAAETFKALTFLSLCGFAVASWILLSRLFARRDACWGLVAVLVLPSMYGGYSVISYAEGFFTGRSLAEPLTLVAMALYLTGKPRTAIPVILIAALIHPLQALPALLIAWIDLMRQNRRWMVLMLVALVIVAASALGAPQLEGLLKVFDTEWLDMTREANPMTMLSLWQTRDWMGLITDFFLVGLLIRYSEHSQAKRLAIAAVAATCVALTISYIGSDLLHLVHITGVQIWRTHWVLHWLAMASVPFLIQQAAHRNDTHRIRTILLSLVVVCAAPTATLLSSGLVNCALIPLYCFWPALSKRSSPAIQKLVVAILCAIVAILLGKLGIHAFDQFQKFGGQRESVRPEFIIMSHPLVVGILVVTALKWGSLIRDKWSPATGRALGFCVALLFCAIAWTQWDRRTVWTREIEAAQSNSRLFGTDIEQSAQIFWEGELVAPWLILGRPSYFNGMQAAGVLFNRETAVEGRRRQDALKLIEFQTTVCKIFNELNVEGERCQINTDIAIKMCEDSGGVLGYLVLESQIDAPDEGVWRSRGGVKNIRPLEYRLYSCKKLIQLQ